jgi:hypothetical protein
MRLGHIPRIPVYQAMANRSHECTSASTGQDGNILADLAIRGFAIGFLKLASVASGFSLNRST